jgi:predicted metalloprotease
MTFNEGMRIDTSMTQSTGGGGRGIAIGGGVGGLVIMLIALFLGIDPGPVMQQTTSAPSQAGPGFDLAQCKTGADANKFAECRVVATGNSLDGVWSQLLKGYTRPKTRLFTGDVQTGCGPASSDMGPFYCPADQTAYFDVGFFNVLKTEFGSSGGPLAQEYVVAHEYGHHIQNLTGDLSRAQKGAKGATGGGVRSELQADCYAGVWAHYAATRTSPTRCPRPPRWATTGSRRRRPGASTRRTGPTAPRRSARSGSPWGIRPVTPTNATRSARAIWADSAGADHQGRNAHCTPLPP